MQEESVKKIALKNIFWKFAERCGAQFVNFFITIVLARILLPEVFGTIAIINVFIVILNVFVDSGMANALIQKKSVDNKDFSSVFFFNILQGLILYIILYFISPIIAVYYHNPEMTAMIRIAGIVLLISSVKNVQQAYVARNLIFYKFFWATLIGTIVSGVVGIWLAFNQYGVWALIVQNILNQLIDTIILWILVKWRPEKYFSLRRIKDLLVYGGKLLCSALLDTIYNNLQSLLIGKIYTENDLAFYSKGKQIPELVMTNINSSLDSVLFPIMSGMQDDTIKLKETTRKVISTSTTLLWPILAAIMASASELIHVVLTDKWSGCIVFLQIFCLSYAFWPIHTANLNAIKAYGQSGTFLKQEIIKKTLGITVLLLVFDKGVGMIAVSVLCLAPINAFINWFPNYKNISYKMPELLKDVGPALGMATVEFIVIFTISFIKINIYLKLGLQITVGVLLYFLMMYLFRRAIVNFIVSCVRKKD